MSDETKDEPKAKRTRNKPEVLEGEALLAHVESNLKDGETATLTDYGNVQVNR